MKKRKVKQGFLVTLCWSLALAIALIFYLDLTNRLKLTKERIDLLKMIIILFIAPFLRKIKVPLELFFIAFWDRILSYINDVGGNDD